jgi:hypothetical protein
MFLMLLGTGNWGWFHAVTLPRENDCVELRNAAKSGINPGYDWEK